MNRTIFLLTGLLNLILLLAGCASTSSMPEDHFYRLSHVDPGETFIGKSIEESLVVEHVKAYGIYNERAILFTLDENPESLKYHHYHHWIDKPTTLIREQLVQYLRKTKVFKHVIQSNGRQVEGVNLQLMVKKFERLVKVNGEVVVTISVDSKVTSHKNKNQPFIKNYRAVSSAENGSMPASIRAFNEGLGDIYHQLTNDIIRSIQSS